MILQWPTRFWNPNFTLCVCLRFSSTCAKTTIQAWTACVTAQSVATRTQQVEKRSSSSLSSLARFTFIIYTILTTNICLQIDTSHKTVAPTKSELGFLAASLNYMALLLACENTLRFPSLLFPQEPPTELDAYLPRIALAPLKTKQTDWNWDKLR